MNYNCFNSYLIGYSFLCFCFSLFSFGLVLPLRCLDFICDTYSVECESKKYLGQWYENKDEGPLIKRQNAIAKVE